MTYQPVRTDEGIEIRDGEEVVTTFKTWPPREADGLETLFEHANISTAQKQLFAVLFGVANLEDETTDDGTS